LDDVVVGQLASVDALFPEPGNVNVEALRIEHQLNTWSDAAIVLNQQNAHADRFLDSFGVLAD
jgi:hypothetical protein